MTKKSIQLNALLIITLIFGALSPVYTPSHIETYSVSIAGAAEEASSPSSTEVIPWGVKRIAAETVHSQNQGRGVKVAILDTGIDLDHPDLRVSGNVSFVEGTANGDDDNGHGTLVAGIVAALDNEIGVVGVAPEIALYSVKVLNSRGGGSWLTIQKGIEWAIENKMQIINMSFGGTADLPQPVRSALAKAQKAGIVLVAASGNAGTPNGDENNVCAPARYAEVIAVGAVDELDRRLNKSSTGDALELAAPGANIYSTYRDGGYAYLHTTSAAAPHVTGVAALLLASGVAPTEVRQILQKTAKDLGISGRDRNFGYGLVDAAGALTGAKTVTTTSPSDNTTNARQTPP